MNARSMISSIAVGCTLIVSANCVSLAEERNLDSMKPLYDNLKRLENRLATQNQSLKSQKLDRLIECIDDEVLQRRFRQLREKIKQRTLSEDEQTILSNDASDASLSSFLEATVQEGGRSMSVGTVAGLQMYSYDLATKTASLANGFGIGTPIRFHGKNVHAIKDVCRTRSYRMATLDDNPKTGTIDSNHWLSITPTMYVSKNTDATDIAIQPALVLSFWHDILHFGTGFNLSGPNQGNVILLFGVGTQLGVETK